MGGLPVSAGPEPAARRFGLAPSVAATVLAVLALILMVAALVLSALVHQLSVLVGSYAALYYRFGHHGLYDIDRIISRTLAYAIVTGVLVGVYSGLVLLATHMLELHSSVAVAVSTLAAAALFNPLRRRVQRTVDHRFNRARYDADQTVMAFADRLKDAVDLDSVRHDLATVVEKSLQPAQVSVWIQAGRGDTSIS
jgi:hypothetical protein